MAGLDDMAAEGIHTLRVNGTPTLEHVDFPALDSFRFPDGGGFPNSYRAFVRHAGWARSFGLWLVYPPVLPGYADGWHGRAGNLTTRFHAVYDDGRNEGFDWMVEPDADWSSTTSLHVFGWSENGDALLWDTAARDEVGEFPVWESRSLGSLHRLGDSLHDALPSIRARAVGLFDSGPHDVEPLPPSRL
jgi:hypothetical protein